MNLTLKNQKGLSDYSHAVLEIVRKLIDRFKINLFKYLFTENEKCLLNQALNLQKQETYKDARCGLSCDYKQDLEDVGNLLEMCENKLWN
jgi:hypothetical protein